MAKSSNPAVKEVKANDYTKVTFSPDLSKFHMTCLDKDIVDLMSRRAYDIAASTRGVKVYLNKKLLPVSNNDKHSFLICLKSLKFMVSLQIILDKKLSRLCKFVHQRKRRRNRKSFKNSV